MITENLHKLGLKGCDITESESTKDHEVVIDVCTRRLVALQPDDKLETYKKLATTEYLQNHLSTMHRRALYSRTITTKDIRLMDIQRLVMSINDKQEELIDYLLEAANMNLKCLLVKSSVLTHIHSPIINLPHHILEACDRADDIFFIYDLLKEINEDMAEHLLPIIKAVILKCMMMKVDASHSETKERFQNYKSTIIEIINSDSDDTYKKCIHMLAVIKKFLNEQGIDSKWDKIRKLPNIPVAPQQDQHLKKLIRAEIWLKENKHQQVEALKIQEEIEQEREQKTEVTKLPETTKALTKTAKSLDDAEVQTEPFKVKIQESDYSVTSLLQPQKPVTCAIQHQTVHNSDKTESTQTIDQHTETSELLAEATPLVIPTSTSSDTDGSVPTKSTGAIPKKKPNPIPKKTKLPSVNPTKSVPHTTEIIDQDSFTKRLIEKCNRMHNDCNQRAQILYAYVTATLDDPQDDLRNKALKAISKGFWSASVLDQLLSQALSKITFDDVENDPFYRKYEQFGKVDGEFKKGMSPWFDEAQRIPFFDIGDNDRGGTYFILREGCKPSQAIKACQDQLFIAPYLCFFQTIMYDVVLEALGEDVFDWYYGGSGNKLQLVSDEFFADAYTANPILKLLTTVSDKMTNKKSKDGTIVEWRNIRCSIPIYYIDRWMLTHGVCVNAKKKEYIVPGAFSLTRNLEHREQVLNLMVHQKLPGNVPKPEPGKDKKSFSSGSDEGTEEISFRFDWSKVSKIRKQYQDFQKQFGYRKLKTTRKKEEEQHHRKNKVESSLDKASKQQPLIGEYEESSRKPQEPEYVAPIYQDRKPNFVTQILKKKSSLIRATRDHKTNATIESAAILMSAIEELEQDAKNLKTTNEIDDDTKKSLERQITTALKKARDIRDSPDFAHFKS